MHRFYSDIEQCFWKFDCSCKLIFTDFLADKIVGIIEKFGKRVGIVTDHGVEKLNYYTNIHKNLKDLCQAEGHIKYESDLESIQAAIKNFKKVKIDVILAIGGGSVLDAAKIIRTSLCSGVAPSNLGQLDPNFINNIKLVTVPTTFGTGSEVNLYAHINDLEAKTKMAIKRGFLLPDLALVDSQVSMETPADKKRIFAVDAFVHALEAFTLKRERSPIIDIILEKSLQLMVDNFIDYLQNQPLAGKNICLSSVLAGYGLNNSRTGLIHSLAVPFASMFNLPHTLSLIPFIKPVFLFNQPYLQPNFSILSKISDFISVITGDLQSNLDNAINKISFDDNKFNQLSNQVMADTVLLKENPVPLDIAKINKLYQISLNSQ